MTSWGTLHAARINSGGLAEKSNVSVGCVTSSIVPGLFDSGCPPLVERVCLAASELGISAIAGREDGASGNPVVASPPGATQSADGRAMVVFLEP